MASPLVGALRAQARALEAVADALEAQATASEWLTPDEAGKLAGFKGRAIRGAVKREELRGYGEGRALRIRRADLDAWLVSRPARARVDVTERDGLAAAVAEDEAATLAALGVQ